MNLKVFGNLALEKDGKIHQKHYIALLALCYVVIEGEHEREFIVNLVQAADKDRRSKMFRNDTKKEDDPERRSREDESYKNSNNNFRQHLHKLKTLVEQPIMQEPSTSYLSADSAITCDYQRVIELFEGNPTEQLEAIALYEEGLFLKDFEEQYPKRHYAVAEELKLWVQDKRDELLTLYLEAKPQHNTQALTLKDLEKQLPKNAGGAALSINADTIVKLASANYDAKEKQSCLNYLEDYIPIHIADVVDDEAKQELTFRVLEVLCLLESPDISLAKNYFSIDDDSLIGIVDDLQEDGWLDDDASSTKILHDPLGKTLVVNRLNRYYSEHLNLVNNLCKHASAIQKKQLLKGFLKHHMIQESDYDAITKLVNQSCHQLINEQKTTEAVDIVETLIHSLKKVKEDYPNELKFWYCYALERNTNYAKAISKLDKFIPQTDINNESSLYYRLIALKASVLNRIGKGTSNNIPKLAQEALLGDSDWAMAEAYNALGYYVFNTSENLDLTKDYFQKSIFYWNIVEEPIRQIGALTNLANNYDRKGFVKETEDLHKRSLKLANKLELSGDPWVRLLLNQTAFYNDLLFDTNFIKPKGFTKRAKQRNKQLIYALKTETIGLEVKTSALQNLGVYFEDQGKIKKAKKYYTQALDLAIEARIPKIQGVSMAGLGKLNKDLAQFEVGLDILKKAGHLEDYKYCKEEYDVVVKSLKGDNSETN